MIQLTRGSSVKITASEKVMHWQAPDFLSLTPPEHEHGKSCTVHVSPDAPFGIVTVSAKGLDSDLVGSWSIDIVQGPANAQAPPDPGIPISEPPRPASGSTP